jgi:methyltransferase (TIGR00027 family)
MNVRTFLAAAAFAFVEMLLFPLLAVGYLLFVARLIAYRRRSGASATVLASMYTRWMQHHLGVRRDEPCVRLMRVMPNVPPLGLKLSAAPTLVAHRLTGYVPPLYRYPYRGVPPFRHQPAVRTTFFDQALDRHLADVDQLVILGAGLDTRAYRLPAGSRVRCFEVDTPQTQQFKREMLHRAGIDTGRVTYVAADFLRERWFAKLVAAGFDPAQRTFFLWESVTMYLDREAVESTLRDVARTAPGSAVAFDYVSSQLIASNSPFMLYARASLSGIGEAWRFGINGTPPVRPRLAAFVAACGLALEELRTFGRETDRRPAEAGFVTAVVPTAEQGVEDPASIDRLLAELRPARSPLGSGR